MANNNESRNVNIFINTGAAQKSIKDLTAEQKKLYNEIRLLTPGTDEFIKKSKQLQEVERNLNKVKQDVRGVKDEISNASKVMGGFKQAFMGAFSGIALANIGQNVLNFFVDGVKKGTEFKATLSQLSAITGATGKDLQFYANEAKEVGKATGIAAKDVLEAYKLIGSAKPELLQNKEALAAITKEAIVLSKASGLELPAAATALTDAMNQFGASADEASRYINTLAAGSQAGAAEVPQVTEALLKFGVAAKSANVNIEESVALIETLAEKGLKGAEAGTAIRNVLAKMSAPDALPKEAREELERLGVNMDVLKDKSLPLSKRIEELGKLQGNAAALTKVFGLENKNAAQILIENKDRYEELTTAVTGTNTAYEQARTATDNLSEDYKKFINALEIAATRASESSDGIARSIVQVGTEIVNNTEPIEDVFRSYGETVENLFGTIKKIIGVFIPMNAEMNTTSVVIKLVATALQTGLVPFKLLGSFAQFAGESLLALVNTGKQVANFFGAEFELDPEATFGKAFKNLENNFTSIGTGFKNVWTDAEKSVEDSTSKITDTVKNETDSQVNQLKDFQIKAIEEYRKYVDKKRAFDKELNKEELDALDKAKEKYQKHFDHLVKEWGKFREELSKIEHQHELNQMDSHQRELAQISDKYKKLEEKAAEFRKAGVISEAEYQATLLRIQADRNAEESALFEKWSDEFLEKKKEVENKIRMAILKGTEKEVEAIKERYTALIREAEKYGTDSTALAQAMENEIALVREKAAKDALEAKKREDAKTLEQERQTFQARQQLLGDFSNLVQQTAAFITAVGIKSVEAQKALTLVAITIDTAKALSNAIAGASAAASAGGPAAPYLLVAYIAQGMAAVLGAFAQVSQVLNADSKVQEMDVKPTEKRKYAGGGFTGPGTGGRPDETGHVPVGIVHANEYVTPAWQLQDPESAALVQVLESKRLRRYADGGFTEASTPSSMASNAASSSPFPDLSKKMDALIDEMRMTRVEVARLQHITFRGDISYNNVKSALDDVQSIENEANI